MRKFIVGTLLLSLAACQSPSPKNSATNRTTASVSITGAKFNKCRIDGDKKLYDQGELIKAVSIIDENTVLLDLDFSSKKRWGDEKKNEGQIIALHSAPSNGAPLFRGSNVLWSPYLQMAASQSHGTYNCNKDGTPTIETYLYVDALSENEIKFRVAPLNITTGGSGCSITGFGVVAAAMICSR